MDSWESCLCLFTSYAYMCTCMRRHLRGTILTWCQIGNQNVNAKKVHFCSNIESHIMKLKFYLNKVNFPTISLVDNWNIYPG